MKSILSCILIMAILLLTMSKSLIYFSYELNKDFIARHLCENRNKPQLHCNGKCHIIKKLKEDEKQNNLPVNIKNNFEVQLYSEKIPGYDLTTFYSGEILFSDPVFSNHQPVFNFFHPPQV